MTARAAGWALLLVLAGAASADSDGHFCIGEGYLAWELREWSAPERKHVLKVVFVGGTDGVSEVRTAPLDDFQLHGMACGERAIVLLSWERKYTLPLEGREAPRVGSVETFPAGRFPVGHEAKSFGAFRQARTLEIPSRRKDRRYELRVQYAEKRGSSDRAGVLLHETAATVVEKDESGRVEREALLYRDEREEPVD